MKGRFSHEDALHKTCDVRDFFKVSHRVFLRRVRAATQVSVAKALFGNISQKLLAIETNLKKYKNCETPVKKFPCEFIRYPDRVTLAEIVGKMKALADWALDSYFNIIITDELVPRSHLII